MRKRKWYEDMLLTYIRRSFISMDSIYREGLVSFEDIILSAVDDYITDLFADEEGQEALNAYMERKNWSYD